jgi:hypothetical protein
MDMGRHGGMTDHMLAIISKSFPLAEQDCGEYKKMKVSGMNFTIRRFRAEGFGAVSVMVASGFFGLMKMDTVILAPTEKDMPLFSYDRVHAMGNDTLIFELYDTLLGSADLSALEEVKKQAAYLPDHNLGEHWYDSIKLPQSLSKKGKKSQTPEFDSIANYYLTKYLETAKTAAPCLVTPKREKASVYVEGLLKNGGPSTDVFKKGIGDGKTATLFRKVLFATEE